MEQLEAELEQLRKDLTSRDELRIEFARNEAWNKHLNDTLNVATKTFARKTDEEATLIGWLRRERDESRGRLELAERTGAELRDTLAKRDAMCKDLRMELDYFKGALRQMQAEHGTRRLQSFSEPQKLLLFCCFRAWAFWHPRSLAASTRPTTASSSRQSPSVCGRASPSIDESRPSTPGFPDPIGATSLQQRPLSSPTYRAVRPPSAPRPNQRGQRALPMRPASAFGVRSSGGRGARTGMQDLSLVGNVSLTHQLATSVQNPVGALASAAEKHS